MEQYDLNGALDREYELTSIAWSSAQTSSTQLAVYNFPDDLFSQDFLRSKISDFNLFRGGVRISLRITANKFLYGKLMVNFEPNPTDNTTTDSNSNIFLGSGLPHVIVSASASETVVFDVPFISPKRALLVNDYAVAEMARFRVIVLNPLTDVNGGTADAQVFVTAQFLDAKLMLPHDQFTPQSLRGAESRNKSEKGLLSSVLEDTTNLSSALESVPFVSPYAQLYSSIVKPTARVLKSVGLSKPTSQDMTSVGKINPFSDMASGKGIDTSIKMAVDPENAISTTPNVAGVNTDEMLLKHIVGTPMLNQVWSFVEATPTTTLAKTTLYDNTLTYVDFIGRNFRYVSGSFKYKFYITASLFHAVRFVIWLADRDDSEDWQNCYHKVIDVSGDTEVEMTIPYCGSGVALPTNSTNLFRLRCKVLTWSQPDMVVSAPIHFNVYKAGGSDMQFGGMVESSFTVQSNPREDFEKVFDVIHPSMSGYKHKNVLYGEEVLSLREMVHRYSAIRQITGGQIDVAVYSGLGANNVFTGPEMFGLLFKYYRGSSRIKLINANSSIPMVGYIRDAQTGVAFPGISMTSTTNPLIEMEAPWYSDRLYESTSSVSLRRIRINNVTPYMFKACGDDFSFMFLKGLPTGIWQPVNTGTFGLPGFVNYMQQAV